MEKENRLSLSQDDPAPVSTDTKPPSHFHGSALAANEVAIVMAPDGGRLARIGRPRRCFVGASAPSA